VVLLNFFSDCRDRSQQKAWKRILLEGAKEGIPVAMELELKLLYTGITRSCDRLFFVETAESPAFDAWTRCLQRHEYANMIKSEVIGERGMMTADDWLMEGLEIASLAGDCEEVELAMDHLKRAMICFQKANHKGFEEKCAAHLKAVRLETAALEVMRSMETPPFEKQEVRVQAVAAFLEAGLVGDATRACKNLCSIPTFAKYLANEMEQKFG